MKRGTRSSSASARDESRHARIPGGKALATYVCQVIVANQKHAWEPVKKVYDANLAHVKSKSFGRMTVFACHGCGKICDSYMNGNTTVVPCKTNCGRFCCKTCCPEEFCAVCSLHCTWSDCKKLMTCKDGDFEVTAKCASCDKPLCLTHKQFCKACGRALCWHPDEADLVSMCVEKHDCQEAKNKKILK